MEVSSPSPGSPQFSPTVPDLSSQRIYTTVGSVYNPTASTPIKPPTRLCRAQRLPPGFQLPPGLDNSDLIRNSLALRDRDCRSPPTTANSFQQYSPLQQNYDRAITPSPEADLEAGPGPDMAQPLARSGNVPPPGLRPAAQTADRQQHIGTIFGDVENSGPDDTLLSFPVKSLTNLASFPNPSQQRAKEVLARGRNMGISRSGTPASTSQLIPDHQRDGTVGGHGMLPQLPAGPPPLTAGPPGQRQYNPSTFQGSFKALRSATPYTRFDGPIYDEWPQYHFRNAAGLHNTDQSSSYDAARASSTRASTPSNLNEIYGYEESVSIAAARRKQHTSGLEPSDFRDSRDLETQSQRSDTQALPLPGHQPRDYQSPGYPSPIFSSPSDRPHGYKGPPHGIHRTRASATGPSRSYGLDTPEPKQVPSQRAMKDGSSYTKKTKYMDVIPAEAVGKYYQNGLPYGVKVSNEPLVGRWILQASPPPGLSQTSQARAVEEAKRRQGKMDEMWDAGTALFEKSMGQFEAEQGHEHKKKSLGVIGGERARSKTFNVFEAQEPTEADHAKPLLNMLYDTLVSYQDEPQLHHTGFVKPEQQSTDPFDDGGLILAPQSQEKGKKKVAAKKSRLGY